jgi:X-Pro dipeptidyl-peptidase
VKQEVGAASPPRKSQPPIAFKPTRPNVSTSQVNTWVPRGFAVVHSDAPGTGLSQGCPTVGGAPEELAPKAVIDWLNGRARGVTTIDGTEEVVATRWSTGKVGMTGTSYNGTIPVAAATTGVRGLEAIIPIAPNTSYYHYYRSHGLVRHPGGWLGEDIDFLYDFVHSGDPARRESCNTRYRDGEFARGRDRASGDYNAFWAERDLLKKVKKIKAAVLMAHAFNDWNVVPEHSIRIATAPGKALTPGRFYRMTFDLQPDDQIIPAGRRIGLMIFSSDRDFTLWPKAGTELTIDLAGTTLRLPIVGGVGAFRAATAAGQ